MGTHNHREPKNAQEQADSLTEETILATLEAGQVEPLELLNLLNKLEKIRWEKYLAWNEAIAEEYFTGKWSGLPVYLDLEPSILDRIGQSLDLGDESSQDNYSPHDNFVSTVASTLQLNPRMRHLATFYQHIKAMNNWKENGCIGSPPFLGILGFLSWVAETMKADELYKANNYMDRLCDLLVVQESKARDRIKRNFRKQTPFLWNELNTWLEDHEGSLGLPTAYPFDSRVYVGIPISQALVREHDRQSLKKLFYEYRLEPSQRLPISDMVDLLKEATNDPNINFSSSLRRLWKGNEQRIAAIACLELESWEGNTIADTIGSSNQSAPLTLVGIFKPQPIPRLVLGLQVKTTYGSPFGKYYGVDKSDIYVLGPSQQQSWSILSPSPSVADTLKTILKLYNEDEYLLQHKPRRIVPLKLDETSRVCIESSRTELNAMYILLVHNTIVDTVRSYLNKITLGNFRMWEDGLQGLPEDWILITDVLVIDVFDPENDDLAILTPRGKSSLTIAGGYALPGRNTYDAAKPPMIRLAAPYENSVQLSIVQTRSLELSEFSDLELDLSTNSTTLDTGEFNLVEGDYRIQLFDNKRKLLSYVNFRLRSSSYPRKLSDDQLGLHYDLLDDDLAALSACEIYDPSQTCIRGATIPSESRRPIPDKSSWDEGEVLTNLGKPSEDHNDPPSSTSSSTVSPTCLLTGAHYWLLEAQSPQQRSALGTCKYCEYEKLFHSYKKRRPDPTTKPTRGGNELPTTHILRHNSDKSPGLMIDNLLDALTFAQKGLWSEFYSLAIQINDAPWFPIESARMLSALGHIDLTLEPSTLRPESWAISPPTLAFIPNDKQAIICGARCPELIQRIRDDAEAIGGNIETTRNKVGPKLIRIHNLEITELKDVIESTGEHLGIQLGLTESAGSKLAHLLPSLNDIAKVLPPASLSGHRIERFDLNSAKWKSSDDVTIAGAYRITTNPWSFAWRSKLDKKLRAGDSRLVKYLAATEMKRTLLYYDRTRKRLVAPLGAALPGLYERAVVLCSGIPPSIHMNKLCYESIPDDVAEAIIRRLNATISFVSNKENEKP